MVTLAEPGMGKTTELKKFADIDSNSSIFSTVSKFLSCSINRFKGKIIYLDALDECRARQGNGPTTRLRTNKKESARANKREHARATA